MLTGAALNCWMLQHDFGLAQQGLTCCPVSCLFSLLFAIICFSHGASDVRVKPSGWRSSISKNTGLSSWFELDLLPPPTPGLSEQQPPQD
jgi:hypothetical protein